MVLNLAHGDKMKNSSLAEAITKAIEPLLKRIVELELSEELAWGLIANAYGGEWDQAFSNWKMAAMYWRDNYHKTLSVGDGDEKIHQVNIR